MGRHEFYHILSLGVLEEQVQSCLHICPPCVDSTHLDNYRCTACSTCTDLIQRHRIPTLGAALSPCHMGNWRCKKCHQCPPSASKYTWCGTDGQEKCSWSFYLLSLAGFSHCPGRHRVSRVLGNVWRLFGLCQRTGETTVI